MKKLEHMLSNFKPSAWIMAPHHLNSSFHVDLIYVDEQNIKFEIILHEHVSYNKIVLFNSYRKRSRLNVVAGPTRGTDGQMADHKDQPIKTL